ncbi:uncharacterized protein [Euwallacea similis]|uniref:uncharacterized protein n=1 Tax=Euwallacea similis TaxID=1736056 RepID=UPI00344BE685
MAGPLSPQGDKGRSLEPPHQRKNCRFSYVATKTAPSNPFINGGRQDQFIAFCELSEDNTKLMQDVNKNNVIEVEKASKLDKNLLKHSFPKILCLKKASVPEPRSSFKTLNVNLLEHSNISASKTAIDNNLKQSTTSADKTVKQTENYLDNNCYQEKPKNRNSFHQNVEEALSSLLWQPYEYQNQNNNEYGIVCNGNKGWDYESSNYSTCSYTPSASPCSLDLEEASDNAAFSPSNTKKSVPSSTFPQCIAVVPPPQSQRRDLHSDVINLNRQEPHGQSVPPFHSRDGTLPGAFVRLPSIASSLSAAEYGLTESATSCFGEFSGESSMQGGSGSVSGTPNVLLTSSVSENGLKSVDSSLNAANIVGLPSSRARYTSVPCGGTSANFQNALTRSQNGGYPQHFRNVSEPSQQLLTRYPLVNNNVPHQNPQISTGANSQIDQHNLQLINHFRSSSVPKSMALISKYDVTASSGSVRVKPVPPHTTLNNSIRVATNNISVPPNNGNISNVNVNFYRAVPVNVVSSVPTIHCLNTLTNNGQGNSVSNVQVLPLMGNNAQQINIDSGSHGVTVHNVNPANSFGSIRGSCGVPTDQSGASLLPPIASTPITNTVKSVVSVQSVFATEVPPHQAGRLITTTAQINNPSQTSIVRTRTFTSTEAQTDDILPQTQPQPQNIREQRRRERRERRQNRRNHPQTRTTNDSSTQAGNGAVQLQNDSNNRLPDILNSHLPPPYSTLPNQTGASMAPPQILPPPPPLIPGAMLPNPPGPVLQTIVPPNGMPASAFVFTAPQQIAPLMQGGAPVPVAVPATAQSGFRFGFPANGFRRSRFSDDSPKGCCGFLSWKPGSLRWFIALIALVAVCCVLVGTALGAMRPAGRDHLTVSLLMIGVGIVLITVSGVAWRLTSHDSSTCRSMLGLGSTESVDVCTRRFVPRLPPSYGRPHHPYAAMMYPEFQYRPPPPSYQASMQEYRLRLLLLDRGNTPQIQAGIQNAVSPPPTYRSHSGSLLRAPLSSRREVNQSEYSCPPSYRSQNSSNRPGGTLTNASILHSRDPSLTMSDSNHESVVNVVNILGSTEEDIALDNITLDSLKMEPEQDINPLKMLLKGSQSDLEGSKDGNLVTIVQTSDQNPVIVTVSGCSANQDNSSTVHITEIPSEMEILAHL